MKSIPAFTHPALAASLIALSVITAGCSKPSQAQTPAAPVAQAQTDNQNPSAAIPATHGTASKLGDLSAFQNIALDVQKLVTQNSLAAAKTRIKDLEISWDEAEAGLKPRSASDWHTLDDAIDHALSALRADTPDQAECQKTMNALLQTFDALQTAH